MRCTTRPRWTTTLAVFSSLIVSSIGQDILEYSEGTSSRVETGQPGENVKGRYSWVDARGEHHVVWYEADRMGFRAFGDVIPGAMGSANGKGPRNVFDLLGTPVIIIGTPAIQVIPKETSNVRSSKKIELGVSELGSDVKITTGSASPGLSLSGLPMQIVISDSLPKLNNVSTESVKNSSNIPEQKPTSNLVNKSLHSTLNNLSKDKIHTLDKSTLGISSLDTKSEKTNKDLNRNNDKNISKSPNVISNQPIFLNELTTIENLTFPQLIAGSRFVLVDHIIIPTQQKLRIGSVPLMPQPVPRTGKHTPVIMGLHSSGRGTRLSKSLTPIALMLKQAFPNGRLLSLGNQPKTTVPNNGPTPRPRKVTGKLNLENFFRPAVNHQTTPKPFELPQPAKEQDYLYPDYYYYDYVDTLGVSGGPLAKNNQDLLQTKSNKRKSVSNRSVEDLDFSDSYEDDD